MDNDTPAHLVGKLEEIEREAARLEQVSAGLWQDIGPAIRQVRVSQGLRLADVSALVGVSDPVVSAVENGAGRGTCGLNILGRIVDVLGMTEVDRADMASASGLTLGFRRGKKNEETS